MRILAILALAALAVPATASAEPGDGERLYRAKCGACHSLDSNRVGPRHRGVFGRKAGAVRDYRYSRALKASEVVWAEDTLERWLANPGAVIPGQRMGFRLRDAGQRRAIISYLKSQSG